MKALKRLSKRHWLTLRDLWIEHLPAVDFSAQYPEPTLWQLPPIQYPPFNPSGTAEFPYMPGVREAIFREAILLTRKFIYCGALLPTLSGAGKNTWTAVAAYEATFYGAKAFCYLLGFANLGRSSSIYLDAFFETERRVGKEKVTFYETLRVHKLRERLTHAMLWGLTERLLDTTKFEGELRELQTQLKITDWDKFTGFRNSVFYDGAFWPLSPDVTACDLTKPVHSQHMSDAAWLEGGTSFPPFADEYFITARMFRKLITGMLQTIADIAPAVSVEIQAFETLRRPAA